MISLTYILTTLRWKSTGKGYFDPKPIVPGGPTVAPVPQPTLGPGETFAPTPEDCGTCREGCLDIVAFVLVDADQNADPNNPNGDFLVTLQEGQTYSLAALEAEHGVTNWALLCVTDPAPFALTPFEVASVGLRDDFYRTHEGTAGCNSGLDFNGEGSPPWTLADDNSGDYVATDFTQGTDWRISCQAFCGECLTGASSPLRVRNFRMVA